MEKSRNANVIKKLIPIFRMHSSFKNGETLETIQSIFCLNFFCQPKCTISLFSNSIFGQTNSLHTFFFTLNYKKLFHYSSFYPWIIQYKSVLFFTVLKIFKVRNHVPLQSLLFSRLHAPGIFNHSSHGIISNTSIILVPLQFIYLPFKMCYLEFCIIFQIWANKRRRKCNNCFQMFFLTTRFL